MQVVHDLLAYVHRRSIEVQRMFDGLDRPIHAGTIAPRLGQQDTLAGGRCIGDVRHSCNPT